MKLKNQIKNEYLLINQDSGYLMIDISNAFAKKGYQVTLLTGRLVTRNIKLMDNVNVKRIIPYKRRNNLQRIFTWSIAFLQILYLVKTKFRKTNLIIVSNPPIVFFLPFLVKNSYSLLIYDIYPDSLIELGFFKKHSYIIKIWKDATKKVYGRAEKIFTLTEGMKKVITAYAGNREVEVVHLWSDNTYLKPIPEICNPFIIKHNLQGKFLVMYSGSLGITQDLNVIIEVARESLNKKDIIFVIIGDGAMKKKIVNQINDYGLTNCIILPWQDAKDVPYSFAASSLAVISIGKQASSVSFPSKFYNFLSVGSPILGLANPQSEFGSLIRDLKVGKCFDSRHKDEIKNYIHELAEYKEICVELRKNSLIASTKYTSENANIFVKSIAGEKHLM